MSASTTLGIIFKGNESGLNSSVDSAQSKLSGMQNKLSTVGDAMSQVGQGMATAGGAIVAFAGLSVNAFAQSGAEIAKWANVLGTTPEEVSKLKFMLQQNNIELEDGADAMKELQVRALDAMNGSEEQAQAFQKLGVSIQDSNGNMKDGVTLFKEVADGMKGMTNATEQSYYADLLMGDAGTRMIPILKQGADGIKKYGDEAERLGLVLDDATIKKSQETQKELALMKQQLMAVAVQIGANLAPLVKQLSEWLTPLISKFIQWSKEHPKLSSAITIGVAVIGGMTLALGSLLMILGSVASGASNLIDIFSKLKGLKLGGEIAEGATKSTGAFSRLGSIGSKAFSALRTAGTSTWGVLSKVFSGIPGLLARVGTVFSSLGTGIMAAMSNPITWLIASIAALAVSLKFLWNSIQDYKKAKEEQKKAEEFSKESRKSQEEKFGKENVESRLKFSQTQREYEQKGFSQSAAQRLALRDTGFGSMEELRNYNRKEGISSTVTEQRTVEVKVSPDETTQRMLAQSPEMAQAINNAIRDNNIRTR